MHYILLLFFHISYKTLVQPTILMFFFIKLSVYTDFNNQAYKN